ncbi:MAG: hypothetical protein ACJ8C4_12425 [Gemmataceae bacterium]
MKRIVLALLLACVAISCDSPAARSKRAEETGSPDQKDNKARHNNTAPGPA